jgi:hypothetical protein
MSALVTRHGGCHCGAVRFSVQVSEPLEVLDCNCSICRMTGFLHAIVPASGFAITQGEAQLTEYRFNTGTARHFFCARCGVKPFYVPRSNPDGWDINARCLDDVRLDALRITPFDDTRRDAATAAIRHLSQP